VGEEVLGFSEEAQGWIPCKITVAIEDKWQVEGWDGSQADKVKGKTEQDTAHVVFHPGEAGRR
jgi:hypothetical protein